MESVANLTSRDNNRMEALEVLYPADISWLFLTLYVALHSTECMEFWQVTHKHTAVHK